MNILFLSILLTTAGVRKMERNSIFIVRALTRDKW
jgi:hypothetical protein